MIGYNGGETLLSVNINQPWHKSAQPVLGILYSTKSLGVFIGYFCHFLTV